MSIIIKEILCLMWDKTALWVKLLVIMVGAPAGIVACFMWWYAATVDASLLSLEDRTTNRISKLEEKNALQIEFISEDLKTIKRQNEMIYQHLLSDKNP